MSETAIRDVSETLRLVLENSLGSTVTVTATSPQRVTSTTDHAVNLYLYLATESGFVKNRLPIAESDGRMRKPPLGLNLFYMLTPFIRDTAQNTDDHLILGRAMRVLYDNPVITDPLLFGDLRNAGLQLEVILCRLNLEEQTRIWNALQMPYRLSVSYEIRTALVDSTRSRDVSRAEIIEMHYETV